jgi:DNA-binding response OmpR family regulator
VRGETRVLVRRRRAAGSRFWRRERYTFGDIEIDTQRREVRKAGEELRLTVKEFDLLTFLAGNPRRVFGRDH